MPSDLLTCKQLPVSVPGTSDADRHVVIGKHAVDLAAQLVFSRLVGIVLVAVDSPCMCVHAYWVSLAANHSEMGSYLCVGGAASCWHAGIVTWPASSYCSIEMCEID